MTDLPDLTVNTEEGRGLEVRARLNEIDRRTSAVKFRLGYLQWLVLPVFGLALVAMLIGLFLGFQASAEIAGGIIGITGGAAGFVHWIGQLRDEASELGEERASVIGTLPAPSGGAGVDRPGEPGNDAGVRTTDGERGTSGRRNRPIFKQPTS